MFHVHAKHLVRPLDSIEAGHDVHPEHRVAISWRGMISWREDHVSLDQITEDALDFYILFEDSVVVLAVFKELIRSVDLIDIGGLALIGTRRHIELPESRIGV